MRRLWRKFYDHVADSHFAQRSHGWFTVLWFLASVPLVLLFGNIVVFVSWLSVYAIVVAHWSSWQATRTEVAQDAASTQIRELLTGVHEAVLRLRKLDPDHPRDEAPGNDAE